METRRPATAEDHLTDMSESELEPVRKWLQSGWRRQVTAEQEQAINDYVTDPKINAKLRKSSDLKTLNQSELDQFKAIEQAIDMAGRRSQTTRIWRGIAPAFKQAELIKLERDLLTRQLYREFGIQSYSIQPSVAGFIAQAGGLVLELESRSGIYISELAGGHEEEVLMSHFLLYCRVAAKSSGWSRLRNRRLFVDHREVVYVQKACRSIDGRRTR